MPRALSRLCVVLVLLAVPVAAQSRRPTPGEAITRNLAPVTQAIDALHLTDDERNVVADVLTRAETCAAEMVEAERHADHVAVQARVRRMELLARLLRARVDAARAEAAAGERERALVEADGRRTQSRAALERVAEQRIALDRPVAVSSFTRPEEPDAAPANAPADAAVEASR